MESFSEAQNWLVKLKSEAEFFKKNEVPSLSVVQKILEKLDFPELSYDERIIVTGTAGKGSVCRLCEQTLLENGKAVLTIQSPEIQVITERIRINGELISADFFAENVLEVAKISREFELMPTYYEAIVLAGILAGKKKNCEVFIGEIGLGGEFDAVNTVTGDRISVLTFIGADHQAILGNKLADIALTKAGIFTKNTKLAFSYEKNFREILDEKSPVKINYITGLQNKLNKKIVRRICREILDENFTMEKLKMPCRWEVIPKKIANNFIIEYFGENLSFEKKIILDGSHSAPRFKFIEAKIKKLDGKKIAIFAMAKNHDPADFREILNLFDEVILTEVAGDREFWSIEELTEILGTGMKIKNTQKAFYKAIKLNFKNIIIVGSFFLCGKIRENFYKSADILKTQNEFCEDL
jgi:folylpolyglutamate synthase/dihydropteroate synthase